MPLSLKAVLRDWKSGELTLLALALVISVACISSINIFSDIVKQQIKQKAANTLGAALMVRSSVPIQPSWQKEARRLNLTQTTTLSFFSMVEGHEQLVLTQVKAVQAGYPLQGEILMSPHLFGKQQVMSDVVPAGKVWLSPRLTSRLNMKLGDKIRVGDATLRVGGVLIEEPGQTGDWFNVAPKLLMNWQDIGKTRVVQPGSRLVYHWLLNGSSESLRRIQSFLKTRLSAQESVFGSESGNTSINKTIARTLDYLNLGTLMSLVLAAVAVSLASFRYSQRHIKQVALLKCFGAEHKQIMIIYLGSMVLLGFLASLVGVFVGYAMQPFLIAWLKGLLPSMTVAYPIMPAVLSIVTAMVILLFFSLTHLWGLRRVLPYHLLDKLSFDEKPLFFQYCLAFVLLGVMSFAYTKSWQIAAGVMSVCILYVATIFFVVSTPFKWLNKRQKKLNLNWRFGVSNIARNPVNSALQVIGIGLALTTLLSLYFLRTGLLDNWREQLPKEAANFFVINIEPEQVTSLQAALASQGIDASQFYPMVRGRLIAINHQAVKEIFGARAKSINALQRELNLSWSKSLPFENRITEGHWDVIDSRGPWVSIEQGLAKRLGVSLGDALTFRIASDEVTAVISSVRRVNWVNFKPNFFMLFKPGLLNDLPQTVITSFYVGKGQQARLDTVMRQFPNLTVIDVANIMKKVRMMIENSAHVIDFMTVFGLLSGLIILVLALMSFASTKQQEVSLLKVLGMSKRRLLWVQSSESILLGFLAGLLSVIAAFIITVSVSHTTFLINVSVPTRWFLFVPVLTSFVVTGINALVLRAYYGDTFAA